VLERKDGGRKKDEKERVIREKTDRGQSTTADSSNKPASEEKMSRGTKGQKETIEGEFFSSWGSKKRVEKNERTILLRKKE